MGEAHIPRDRTVPEAGRGPHVDSHQSLRPRHLRGQGILDGAQRRVRPHCALLTSERDGREHPTAAPRDHQRATGTRQPGSEVLGALSVERGRYHQPTSQAVIHSTDADERRITSRGHVRARPRPVTPRGSIRMPDVCEDRRLQAVAAPRHLTHGPVHGTGTRQRRVEDLHDRHVLDHHEPTRDHRPRPETASGHAPRLRRTAQVQWRRPASRRPVTREGTLQRPLRWRSGDPGPTHPRTSTRYRSAQRLWDRGGPPHDRH